MTIPEPAEHNCPVPSLSAMNWQILSNDLLGKLIGAPAPRFGRHLDLGVGYRRVDDGRFHPETAGAL
jgi:hypothetical protein